MISMRLLKGGEDGDSCDPRSVGGHQYGREVLVLSARPGRIRKRVSVKFDLANRTPMRSRSAPEFKDYFNTIWKELNDHA